MFLNLFLIAIRELLNSLVQKVWNRRFLSFGLGIIAILLSVLIAIGWFGAEAQPESLPKVPTRNNRDLCFCLSSRMLYKLGDYSAQSMP